MEKKHNVIWELFTAFLKIGAFTFGGGYAMISVIRAEVTEKRSWITDEEMMQLLVIAESTPGVLAVNTATFTGYKIAKTAGAAVATLGVMLPSVILISLLSLVFDWFRSLQAVEYIFGGIRAGVVVLIITAIHKLSAKNPKGVLPVVITGAALILTLFFKVNTIYVLIGAAVVGIVHMYAAGAAGKRGGKGDV